MAATCQYIAVPLFALACTLLLHLSSPTGTGACYGLYNIAGEVMMMLLGEDIYDDTSTTEVL